MSTDESIVRRKGRILVVDDTPANLRLLTKLLGDQGYIVHAANGGDPVFLFLQSTLPDLILLDIRMPDMDGYEVCRRLKADERTFDIPVIFISAADDALDKVKAFASGGVDYIVKPFQEEEVLARVETHLSLRNLQKHLEELVDERTIELAEAKEAVVASKQLLQRIIDNSTALIYVKDLEGRYLLTNGRFQELFSLAEEECIGKTDYEVFPHGIAEALRVLDQKVIAAGETLEAEEVLPYNDTLHTYISVKSPLYDEAGQIYAVCGISTDITDRVQAENAIRELNDMLEHRLSERISELHNPSQ